MSLFRKTKKEKKENVCGCLCGCGCATPETTETTTDAACCSEKVNGICCIKVLGAGCASCHQMYENAKEAAKNIGLNIEVEYITDLQKVMDYGVVTVPALVVNDKVIAMGKLLKSDEVIKLLGKLEF